jgi:O-antigen/teichoic acid export membrane protein
MPYTHPLDLHLSNFRSLLLFVLALVNYALMYTANIVLARSLTVSDFDDYNVALSVVTLLSSVATLGLEKYALSVIALYTDQQNWPLLRGFWLFSLAAISAFSLLLMALLSMSLELILALHQADYHIAIVVFAGFLPIIALTLFLVEVIAAQGGYFVSIALYRLLLPLLYIVLLLALSLRPPLLSALTAVICYGSAWVITFIIMWCFTKTLLPVEMTQTTAHWQGKKWLKHSLPLVLNSLMLTIMTSGGVIILELLLPSGLAVGEYAIAVQTGGFIALVGTSTNRYYLPLMVVLIEHNDQAGIQKLMRQRIWVVGSLILTLLLTLFFAGPSILNLFGSQFSEAYLTMLVIAVGAAISALFADIPYYLQFMGRHRSVLGLTFCASFSMVILSFSLGTTFGALGVAIAYMMPVALLFIGFRIIAARLFRRIQRESGNPAD